MSVRNRVISFALLAVSALAACSQQQAPAPASAPAAAPVADAQMTKALDLYRKLLQEKSWELAAPIGKEIVEKYPASPAAKEVQETLSDATAKATAITTHRRLERLWIYQSGKESGGDQNTASIYSGDAADSDRVRLILRRHSAWGQSAYLFGSGKGFECRGTCSLAARFDDQPPTKIKAYLPPTGEPALFISDDKAFIARLGATQKISIDVTEKGKGTRTLVFEVGGFDPGKFPPLAKKR
ncbi:hypothetical protein [Dokdonella soli]|uniref:Outer membrane lipoprotein carrier protein LolA n=1 Tax=Dokdonella soli TaxID=529810 RepID=A0ABN1IK06_9GAMM